MAPDFSCLETSGGRGREMGRPWTFPSSHYLLGGCGLSQGEGDGLGQVALLG